jgi:mono/diheme cytochrome c family protein
MPRGLRGSTSVFAAIGLELAFAAVPARAGVSDPDPALVQRGEYLARAGDCASCHTAPTAGSPAFAGGYLIPSPIGSIVSTNITPSKTHGIGGYSLADFSRAVRNGVLPDGTYLYPAMPYPSYAGVTDEDLAALYAYFMLAVSPVDVSPPRTTLPFPFKIRPLMIGWNLVFAGEGFTPAPGAPAEVQRGQYLVQTLGHCGACHTPRNAFMGEETSRLLSGGNVAGWHAPNITSDPVAGIGGWSVGEIVTFLRDGSVQGKNVAAGSMAEAVEHSLQYLSGDDLRAVATYLKTVPAIANPDAPRSAYGWTEARPVVVTTYETGNGPLQSDLANASTLDGAVLYNGACASCHGIDGGGTPDLFYPSLTANATVGSINPANLVMTIAQGVDRRGARQHAFMPSFAGELTNAQIAAVASYVTARFGNPKISVDEAVVAELRAGGPTPMIVTVGPYAAAAGLFLLALILVAIATRRLRSRRKFHPEAQSEQ